MPARASGSAPVAGTPEQYRPPVDRERGLVNKGQAVFRTYTTLARCLAALPEPVALGVAKRVGDVLFVVRHEQRRMVSANLRRVLGAEPSDDQACSTIGHGARFGPTLATGSKGPGWGGTSPSEVEERTFVQGLEHLAEGMAAGKGVIMALPHVGSWEYGGAFLATQDMPMTSVAERIEPPELFDFFVEQRAAMGLTIVPLDASSGSAIMSTLRRGGTGRPAERPGPRRQRHRGRVLRRADHHARGAGHAGAPDRGPAGHRRGLQRARAATTGPSSSRPSTPPGRGPCATTWPVSPRRSPPGSRG